MAPTLEDDVEVGVLTLGAEKSDAEVQPRTCLEKVYHCAVSCCLAPRRLFWDAEDEELLLDTSAVEGRNSLALGTTAPGPEPCGLKPLRPLNARIQGPLLPGRMAQDQGKLCVVFDLDETLVQNRLGPGLLIERPGLGELLGNLKGRCEIVLWTASREDIGAPVVQQIDRNRDIFTHIVYRDARWFEGEDKPYTKDLSLLGRDVNRTVIVENTIRCVRLQPANAVMVDDFWGDNKDEDLSLNSVLSVIESLIENPERTVPELIRESPHLIKKHSQEVPGSELHYAKRGNDATAADGLDYLLLPMTRVL